MAKHSILVYDNDMRYPELQKKHSNVERDIVMHKSPKDGAVKAAWSNTLLITPPPRLVN